MILADLPAGVRLREFTFDDVPALAAILNRIYPDEPTTVEQEEHWEKTYPAGNPRLRYVAETGDGQMVGFGACQYPFWSASPDFYSVYVVVDSPYQQRGIGQALLAAVTPFAVAQGFHMLQTSCKEDSPGTIRFLERSGFAQFGIRFESALDVQAFDETPFLATVARAQAAGYEVVTLADARQEDLDADRKLYEVFAATIVDVPFPGGVRAEPDYDNFRAGTLDAPNTVAAGIFIARRAGRMVGLTTLELLPNNTAITGMTGVLAEHRGRGVATLLKLASLRYLKAQGCQEARTHNDTANPPILAINEKLGYRRLPGWLAWAKKL